MGRRRRKSSGAIVAVALLAAACNVHIVGDSSAWLVQLNANSLSTITMSESTTPNCGFGPLNGNRVSPSAYATGGPGYPNCVLDWNENDPDEPEDNIVAFVSIHDAMCSTIDGCLPFDTGAYATAHADLVATGHPVIWVEVPEVGDTEMRARIAGLNAAVATALGCTLVDQSIRVAQTYDGLHYTTQGALLVAGRLSELDESDACP